MSKSFLFKVLNFASKKHKGQLRDGGSPFISHPLTTMGILLEFGETEERVLAAAVLHDVMEDCGVSYWELVRVFGARVAGIVREVSMLPDGSFPLESRGGFVVKMVDRLSNLNDLKNCEAEKIKRYIIKCEAFNDLYAEQFTKSNKLLYWALRDQTKRLRADVFGEYSRLGCGLGQ